MDKFQLFEEIKKKKSFLCVGLDPVLEKLPEHLLAYEDPIFEFNKQIIEATEDLCVAYKPNTAFYECYGIKGWESLVKTCNVIPKNTLNIADAKRGDIGNTSGAYAAAFFNKEQSGLGFDAITVAPYMGSDSVKPFLAYKNKWVILLALTSNEGSNDFQHITNAEGKLFEQVIKNAQQWASDEQLMYVVGATQPQAFAQIRKLVPNHFLLVPGVGAQGGNLQDVCKHGLNAQCGLLVNAGRSIIYAGKGEDFADKARTQALALQQEMEQILAAAQLI